MNDRSRRQLQAIKGGDEWARVVVLDGSPVLAMSTAGMLPMKEQYPHRKGGPWRLKDVADIETLRAMVSDVSSGSDGHFGPRG